MWGKKQGKIAATYSREPTTVDGQTDTHAGVLYLQSSVEGERWKRDVIVITTTTTREKGQSSCKEPHINKKKTQVWAPGLEGRGPIDKCLKPGLSAGREERGANEYIARIWERSVLAFNSNFKSQLYQR